MAIKIFITGTDTDIGKTMISGLIADYLHRSGVDCGYLKLVSCGSTVCEDTRFIQENATVLAQNVYHFPMPASPHLSAEQDSQCIDIDRLDQAMATLDKKHDVVIIEGAGGLLVPLTRSLVLADYIATCGVKALVVARSGLGTINHTLLTLEGLQSRSIAILGVLFNDEQVYPKDDLLVTDNMQTIHEFSGIPVFGRVARFDVWSDGRLLFTEIGKRLTEAFALKK